MLTMNTGEDESLSLSTVVKELDNPLQKALEATSQQK